MASSRAHGWCHPRWNVAGQTCQTFPTTSAPGCRAAQWRSDLQLLQSSSCSHNAHFQMLPKAKGVTESPTVRSCLHRCKSWSFVLFSLHLSNVTLEKLVARLLALCASWWDEVTKH